MTAHKSRPCHPDNYRKGRTGPVEYLVVHYVGATGTAEQNAAYYGSRGGIGASAHYFVGHGGEVWQSVDEADTAWHCGGKSYRHGACRNGNAIGVELCCRRRGDLAAGAAATEGWYFEPETLRSAVELCRDIVGRYGLGRDRVLRHYDVTGKVCPAPFVYDGGAWEDFLDRVFAPAEGICDHLGTGAPATPQEDGPSQSASPTAPPKGEPEGSGRPQAAPTGDEEGGPGGKAAPADGWAEEAWDKAGKAGVLDGTRPTEPVTRQELAVVLERLGLLE